MSPSRPWTSCSTRKHCPAASGFYRAFDETVAKNGQRQERRRTMPVLAIGGAASYGDHVAEAVKFVADDVLGVVIPGAGHWVAEEASAEMLAALTPFLTASSPDGANATASRTVITV